MCGISGYVGKGGRDIEAMNRALAHRGPDWAGLFRDDTVALGHRLLAIRESKERSRQPFSGKGPWVLLYNGQLYNTKAMRAELGATYAAEELDTALLYGLIEKHGWNFIPRIHGMFAIALYNAEEKIVRLYRDPSGQKNLYYYAKGDDFIFSSEIKGILAHGGIDRALDEEAVLIATRLGYIPGNKTLFRYIKKVQPSETVAYHAPSRMLSFEFFTSESAGYYTGDLAGTISLLVEEHLQSKERVVLNLSGGLDSSLLLHEMARQGAKLFTYTNRFEGGGARHNTDADLAKRLASAYGSTHRELLITKETFLDNFVAAYETIEEPDYNVTLPAYFITAQAEGVHGDKNRVVLSGDGGDEVFGGYDYYYELRRLERLRRLLSTSLYTALKNWRSGTNYDLSRREERWLFFKEFKRDVLARPLAFSLPEYLAGATGPLFERYSRKSGAAYEGMLLDRFLWLASENFIRSDKLYMSQSMEMRSPFSYHPFRVRIDTLLNEAHYITKKSNKALLREAYRGKLPDYIIDRTDKSGWRSPIAEWYDDRFKALFLDILSSVGDNDGIVAWKNIKRDIERSDRWPGKYTHLYLSLAILSKKFGLAI